MLQEYKYSHSLILPVIKFGVNRGNPTIQTLICESNDFLSAKFCDRSQS